MTSVDGHSKKVLMIAYAFPPAGGGGVQRTTKFAKYLPASGWEVVVLTATSDSFVETDDELLDEVERTAQIERVRSLISQRQTHRVRQQTGTALPWEKSAKQASLRSRLLNFLRTVILIPDSQILWVIPCVLRLKKIVKKHQPDIIMATAPPYSAFLLGLCAKVMSRKPLVLDFRDPWTQWFQNYRKQENRFRKWIESHLEKLVLNHASLVLATTPNMLAYLQNRAKPSHSGKFALIYNGYDEQDYHNVRSERFDKFTVVYTGKIISNLYSALPFLQGLQQMIVSHPEIKERIQVFFIGAFDDPEAEQYIARNDLADCVAVLGYLDHRRCLSYQLGAEVLLLILNPGVTDQLTISGKLFEYLRAQKEILALIPENSAAAKILKEANAGHIVSDESPAQIAATLYELYRGTNDAGVTDKSVAPFSRQNQAKQLAGLLDAIVTESKGRARSNDGRMDRMKESALASFC